MGLSDRAQALLTALATLFLALGSAEVTMPNLPEEWRVSVAIFLWICGIIGFELKEALGIQK